LQNAYFSYTIRLLPILISIPLFLNFSDTKTYENK